MMLDQNPTQIQFATRHATPLILIHDGGGSTFGYFTLGSLNRDVYGIHNPHFFSGEPWTGGMNEMAETYIQLLKDSNITGSIFLGGEFAHYFAFHLSLRFGQISFSDCNNWQKGGH